MLLILIRRFAACGGSQFPAAPEPRVVLEGRLAKRLSSLARRGDLVALPPQARTKGGSVITHAEASGKPITYREPE